MTINGIVAGIGDKTTNQNVITPDFDANIIDFIVGGSAIVEGLDYIVSGNNPVLKKGVVVHKGYRGELLEDIDNIAESNVYAQFVLHNDGTTIDTFSILTTNDTFSPEITEGSKKTYNLLLYKNGERNIYLNNMPAYAYHSLTCDTVIGTIGSSVTGTTQDLGDNSLKIATTQYVENRIAHDIGHETKTINLTDTKSNGEVQQFATLTLQRKAHQVVCKLDTTTSPMSFNNVVEGWLVFNETLPVGFRPTTDILTSCGWRIDRDNMVEYYALAIVFQKSGGIGVKAITNIPNLGDNDNVLYGTSHIGWKTN